MCWCDPNKRTPWCDGCYAVAPQHAPWKQNVKPIPNEWRTAFDKEFGELNSCFGVDSKPRVKHFIENLIKSIRSDIPDGDLSGYQLQKDLTEKWLS